MHKKISKAVKAADKTTKAAIDKVAHAKELKRIRDAKYRAAKNAAKAKQAKADKEAAKAHKNVVACVLIAEKPTSTDNIMFKYRYHDDMTVAKWYKEYCGSHYCLLESSDAMNALAAGIPVKRATWLGYWMMIDGKLEMHGKDGRIVYLDKCDEPFTLHDASCDDWVLVTQKQRLEMDAMHALMRKHLAKVGKEVR